jgi:probable F420-dependent oxidoreductase
MTAPRPFRFIAPMPPFTLAPSRWRDEIQRIEDIGFSSVSVSEHFVGGWAMDPLAAMLAAADASERLRVLSLVLLNDLRHPAALHRAAASVDVLSGGRLELGLGAGWSEDDYVALGLRFDPPSIRIDRLAESLEVIDRLFGDGDVTFEGVHYQVRRLAGLPKAVQRPRPPLLVGGGGRRILELAARTADIIGVHAALTSGHLGPDTVADFSAERMATKVDWIRAALTEAGREPDAIELQFSVYLCQIDGHRRAHDRTVSTFAEQLAVHPDLVADSPSVLLGSVDACADLLVERRARYGFSYLRLSDEIDSVAPLVHRLAGR